MLRLMTQRFRKNIFRQSDQMLTGAADYKPMLTHVPAQERPSLDDIQDSLARLHAGLQNNITLSIEEKKQLELLVDQLCEFELGRFLIANQGGLSGWWTYYCILGYNRKPITQALEKFLLEECPSILATRERFNHFKQVAQDILHIHVVTSTNLKVASVPGGMAADMLSLDLNIDPEKCQLEFVSIDLDSSVFTLANQLAKELNGSIPLECRQEDAWSLSATNEFDLVISNGLNIYEPNRERVIQLYQNLLNSLKPGGTLITSALTPPPTQNTACEWNFNQIDQTALAKQISIFAQILQATWANFCSTDEMISRLTEAGFEKIKVIPDTRNMFPTFVAQKPGL